MYRIYVTVTMYFLENNPLSQEIEQSNDSTYNEEEAHILSKIDELQGKLENLQDEIENYLKENEEETDEWMKEQF